MQNSVDAIEKFKHSIASFLPTWQSVAVRSIVDLAEGQVLSLVACLTPEPPTPIDEIQPVIQDTLFTRGALPINELNSLLDGLAKGLIKIGNRTLTTSPFSQWQFNERAQSWDDVPLGWPELSDYRHLLLYSIGPDISQLAKTHNLEAMATAFGFRSLPEMTAHRVQFAVGQSRLTRIELFAPIQLELEITQVRTVVQIKVSAHEMIETSGIHLSYRLQDDRGNRVAGGSLPYRLKSYLGKRCWTQPAHSGI